MSDSRNLVPLSSLARLLNVPQYVLRDLPPTQRAASAGEPLYDLDTAKTRLRQQGIIFVKGEPVLIR
jgi:hypothetical protein